MDALLVIDVQNGIVGQRDFSEELRIIQQVIRDFNRKGSPILFVKHLEDSEESPLGTGSSGSELHSSVNRYSEQIIEKRTPSAFFKTELSGVLERYGVTHVFIVGFETEFCCMFTAIAAYDRGYKVTFIKDAISSGNTEQTYGMAGLNINGFVSSVLQWSGAIETVDYRQFADKYNR